MRARAEPLALAAMVREEVVRALPAVAVVRVSTADVQLAEFSAQRRLQTWLLTAFALLALSLAAIGDLRIGPLPGRGTDTRDRRAYRARRDARDVMSLVLLQGMRMPAAGIAIGLIASVWLTRLMAHLLFEVTATDLTTFAMVTVVLAMVAATACYLAARRTTRVDPLRTIRHS